LYLKCGRQFLQGLHPSLTILALWVRFYDLPAAMCVMKATGPFTNSQWRKNFFVCSSFSRYLFMFVVLLISTHTLKMILVQLQIKNDRDQIQMILLTWYLTQMLTIMFLTDQSDSDMSDTDMW